MSTDGSLQIRAYRDADARAVRECIVELQEYERQIDPRLRAGESMATDYLAYLHRQCRESAGTILVAEADGRIVGFVSVLAQVVSEELDSPPGTYSLVTDLVVTEGARRRGIGAALLRAAEQYAVGGGAIELRIGVLSENQNARDLYVRAGFAPYVETLAKRLDPTR